MSLDRLSFDLRLTVRSPFLFRGLDGRFVGVDVTHVRDERGRPIIPADQVRGVFRQNLEILAEHVPLPAGDIDAVFGRKSSESDEADAYGSNQPFRGRIIFEDLVATQFYKDPDDTDAKSSPFIGSGISETTRIQIDDDTGSVKAGALQVLELVAPFGSAVSFIGRIVVYDEAKRADGWAKALSQALALILSIGAMKSPGWGEVLPGLSTVTRSTVSSLSLPGAARPLPERPRLRVTFDRPILVDARKVSGNAFEGRTVVPGAVFKGALARRLELAGLQPESGLIAAILSAIGFRHARPEAKIPGAVVDRPLPLSLVTAKSERGVLVGDAALIGMEQGALIDGMPGAFQPDWKDSSYDAAHTAIATPEGWGSIPFIARTHTQIDEEGGAAEHQLFTTIARSVIRETESTDGKTPWAGRTWILDVDLAAARAVERDGSGLAGSADRLVELLLQDGLDGIGRTNAHASFDLVGEAPLAVPKPVKGHEELWVVTLETPAAIIDGSRLIASDGRFVTAEEAYRAYWRGLLPDAELVNFFAAQDYRGGYLSRRRRLHGDTYFPFLVTREGSVFVLRTKNRERLASLLRKGLPHFTPADGTVVTWANSPWVPENGYGEIRIDHLSDDRTAALAARVRGIGMREAAE